MCIQPPHGRIPQAGSGFVATRVLVLFLAAAVVAAGVGWVLKARHDAQRCEQNLYEIYAVLEMYEIRNGTLPRLALYPDDARQDSASLRVLIEREGVGGDICLCPSSPRIIREAGLSYLWNVGLSGQKLAGRSRPEWMLVEIHALSDQVPAPHRGGYHILYTDGRVVHSRQPPPDLLMKP